MDNGTVAVAVVVMVGLLLIAISWQVLEIAKRGARPSASQPDAAATKAPPELHDHRPR